MLKKLKSVGVLVAICTVVALLLALTNQITAPIIEKNQAAAANEALLVVMPEGKSFEKLEDISGLPSSIVEAYRETSGKGYVFKINATGWQPNMILMCGVSADGVITGAICLESGETNGAEKTYGENFIGKDAAGAKDVDTVGGASAPLTKAGYKQAMIDAINSALMLGGNADVDFRTPEQILADNLNAALPAAEGEFTNLYVADLFSGLQTVETLYAANNGEGYVAVIGEQFIGVDVSGKVLTEGVDNAAAIEADMAVIHAYQPVDLTQYLFPSTITKALADANGNGFILYLSVTGYASDMQIACSVTTNYIVKGTVCIASNETLGKEKDYGKNFAGKDATGVEEVDTIATATLTTTAYKEAVKLAIQAARALNGEDVGDLRDPAQVLAEGLDGALPEGNGEFEKPFLTEYVEGVTAIYKATNGVGYVVVIGEEFVATDAEGNSDNATAAEAVKALLTSSSEAVDLTAYEGIHETVQKVDKTANDNYIVEIHGLGYAYYDDDHGYGQQRFVPIVIRVSLTPDGKIIDCLTVSHEESKNFGAACAEESYCSQFDGKTVETYTEVDGIAGATITTNGPKGDEGYLKAILRCFETVAILEGGAN